MRRILGERCGGAKNKEVGELDVVHEIFFWFEIK